MIGSARETWPPPSRLRDCHSIADLRLLARRRLPTPIFHQLDGGGEDEATLRRNEEAFAERRLIPRSLVDVETIDTSVRLLGQNLEWPVILAPTGASRFYHPDGELAIARAAAGARTLYSLSTMATHTLEAVADASAGAKMLQVYIFKDRGFTIELIERARAAGYGALCLTVDTPVAGKRERDLRLGWGVPIRLSAATMLSFARHPLWCAAQARRGRFAIPNVAAASGKTGLIAQTHFVAGQLSASMTWKDAQVLIERWKGPFAIKGIMALDDARRAVDIGASTIVISNHGGRQLDGAAAPLDVLPAIADAVGDSIELILEGGVRRGTHLLKALALGARACSIGRPYLYGLAAGGQAGVAQALAILRAELVMAMRLAGLPSLKGGIGRALRADAAPDGDE